MFRYPFLLISLLALSTACLAGNNETEPALPLLTDPRETHLVNVRQLTFGGQNAEAYFSFDDSKLVFQSTPRDAEKQCDQIYVMNVDGSDKQLLSSGNGVTTCSFFYPDGKHFLYASTHDGNARSEEHTSELQSH